jgi:hypothetical protein
LLGHGEAGDHAGRAETPVAVIGRPFPAVDIKCLGPTGNCS